MNLTDIKPGKYVVAVSGGVDSMVLLDLLSKNKDLNLIVAHFDHGIRDDSIVDTELVKNAASSYGLSFELAAGHLGKGASEETARDARYEFLNKVKATHKADGLITAHHRDDVIETALINILRGTGPRGLSSLVSNKAVIRPLLNVPKSEIIDFAIKNKIIWREDSTNEDTKYLRNYLRANVVPKLSDDQKQSITINVDKVANIQIIKEESIAKISQSVKNGDLIDRQMFALLPNEVGLELVTSWLRDFGYKSFDRKTIEKANLIIRTAKPNTTHDISKTVQIVVDKLSVSFK